MFPTEGAAMAWTTLNGNGDNANDNVGGGNGATSLVLGRGLYALANKCRRHLRVVWEIWPCVLHRCDLARSACSSLVWVSSDNMVGDRQHLASQGRFGTKAFEAQVP